MIRTVGSALFVLLASAGGCSGTEGEGPCEYELLDAWVDADGDHYGVANTEPEKFCPGSGGYAIQPLDCDDADDAVHPEVQEKCNGLDDDCNGQVDDGLASVTLYTDADNDGYGTRFPAQVSCLDPTGNWSRNADDCDDEDPDVNPDGFEVCNGGIDDDCSGLADDLDPDVDGTSMPVWYRDFDADGFGDRNADLARCVSPADYVDDQTDCDDGHQEVNPAATEVCDNLDNDCDGQTDDADASLDQSTQLSFYSDGDGDGYGDAAIEILACRAIPGLSSASPDDCDDAVAAINPGAAEQTCDLYDNDCDLASPDNPDRDTDTWGLCDGDCDDLNDTISPSATELPSDSVDQNCNMLEACYADVDGDHARTSTFSEVADPSCTLAGHAPETYPLDCDDGDPGVDVIVGWLVDGDGDGVGTGPAVVTQCLNPGGGLVREIFAPDCDDLNPLNFPGNAEICEDGLDQDCSGADRACNTWLYTVKDNTDLLQRFDVLTRTLEDVGPLGTQFQFGDLAYDEDSQTLYMIDGRGVEGLHTVDLTTGAASLVGIHGRSDLFGLTWDPVTDTLYAVRWFPHGLFTLDQQTGAATLIGTPAVELGSMCYDSARAEFLAMQDGPGNLYAIDVATGALSFRGNDGAISDSGMAYVPESDLIYTMDFMGDVYEYDPNNGYSRNKIKGGLGSHDGFVYIPDPPN